MRTARGAVALSIIGSRRMAARGRALASGMPVQASAKVVRMPRVATRPRALDKGDGARSLRTERVIQVSDE
jgi:hypothetical protein